MSAWLFPRIVGNRCLLASQVRALCHIHRLNVGSIAISRLLNSIILDISHFEIFRSVGFQTVLDSEMS